MSEYSEIREKLERLAGKSVKFHVAEVVSVENDTCTIKMGDTTISDVRLCATLTDNKKNILIVPKIGSYVLLADLSEGKFNDMVVVQFSEIDTISINGGTLGGLVKIKELKTQLDKMTARIDGIMNALKNAQPTAQDGGAAYKLGITTALDLLNDKENFSKIEDTKITH